MKTIGILLLGTALAHAQLSVTVSPVNVAGQKGVVALALKNNFREKIDSARAVCFLLDEQGTMVGQATRWVIGGTGRHGLAPGSTNAFYFVITGRKPFTTTNLTASVSFSRLVLEGGKVADPRRNVIVTSAGQR